MAVSAPRAPAEVPEKPETTSQAGPPGRLRWRFGLYAGHLLTVWALAVSNGLLALAILAVPWVGPRRLPADRDARRFLGVAGLYLALLVAATIGSRHPAQSFSSLSEVMNLATLLLAAAGLRGERRIRGLVDALILLGALVGLSGLLQLLAGYGSIDRRIRGPFSHYMTFAGILLMLDLLLVARMLVRHERRTGHGPTPWLDRPAVAWSAVAVINLALVVSLTRSAWLALVVALAALFGTVRPRLLLALPPAAVLFLVLAPVPLLHRVLSITDLSDPSNYDRIAMAEAGARMIAEESLLGVGPDQVRRLYPLYRDPRWRSPVPIRARASLRNPLQATRAASANRPR